MEQKVKNNKTEQNGRESIHTMKQIWSLYTEYKWHLCLLLVGVPLISGLDIWSQTMLGTIIDQISDTDAWCSTVCLYAVAITAMFIVKQGHLLVEQKLEFQIIYRLRAVIAEKVLRMNSTSLSAYSSDDVMYMWNEDVCELQAISVKNILQFAILVFSAVLALIELSNISIYFPLIAIAVNILSILPVRVIGTYKKKRTESQRESQVTMNEKFYTILNAILLIKSYGKEEEEISEFEELNERFADEKIALFLSARIYKSLSSVMKSIAPTVLLLIANVEIREGRMTIGDIVLATSLLATISKPFGEVGNFIVDIKGIEGKFEHLFRFLEEENEPSAGADFAWEIPYELIFSDVSYQRNGTKILEHINLRIQSGEKIAVVGESGAGKTTLNDLILRLYAPTAGTILLNGRDIREYDLDVYRRGIHYSQSNTYLSYGTMMENLALLDPHIGTQTYKEVAERIGFHSEIMSMADGYHTVVSAGGSNLSGGQKKKIAVIRALAHPCQLYVLDEPTRGMDAVSASAVMNALLDRSEATMLFTIHNFYAIERMDKIVVMKEGRIIAEGKHMELYQNCGYYRELYDNRKRGRYESGV